MRSGKLTNLRFADDLLLCAGSFKAAQTMLTDLIDEAGKYGLQVHESKTKFLWNGQGVSSDIKQTIIRRKPFEVLDETGSTMYLGRLFSFDRTHDIELKSRVSKAWAKFAIYRSELTGKSCDLERRLKLFKAVVQPTLLYGCSCWTMTREREQKVRTTQRKMLRAIVGTRRQLRDDDLEAWVDWVIRATREAECAMQKFGVPDWCEEIHRRRYRWAGHVARRQDGRWTREVLTWSVVGSWSQKRPLTRWSDTFSKFFCSLFDMDRTIDNSFWMDAAQDRDTWHASESEYIDFVLRL